MSHEYLDDFSIAFKNEKMFLDFLNDRGADSIWKTAKTQEITFLGLENGDVATDQIEKIFDANSKSDVFKDTMKNTRLIAKIDNDYFPVRDTALKTLLERANISGQALRKVSKSVFAKIVNYCINVSKGDSLILHNYNKISAFHSGDNSYSILEMSELFNITSEYIEWNYNGSKFIDAVYSHSLATCVWELNNDDLIKVYKDFLKKHKMDAGDIKPALRLTTSDVGISGANLYPMLYVDGIYKITLGSPIKLEHRNSASLADFETGLNKIFSQFELAFKRLMDLALIEIDNPEYCMGSIMKKIGVHKKVGLEALDNFKARMSAGITTAHEIYCSINEVLFIMSCNNEHQTKIAMMEEIIARALKLNWKDYDMPGVFIW